MSLDEYILIASNAPVGRMEHHATKICTLAKDASPASRIGAPLQILAVANRGNK
jgi:hypothetical protein